MPQDIHSALDECRSQTENLVEELRRYESSVDLNQAAADNLESVANAPKSTVRDIEPFTVRRMRQHQILVVSLLGTNALIGVLVLVAVLLKE